MVSAPVTNADRVALCAGDSLVRVLKQYRQRQHRAPTEPATDRPPTGHRPATDRAGHRPTGPFDGTDCLSLYACLYVITAIAVYDFAELARF
jgi:hypothetical protein